MQARNFFENDTFGIYDPSKEKVVNLLSIPCAYLIFVDSDEFGKELVYAGVTDNFKKRIQGHSVFKMLLRCFDKKRVYVLFKDYSCVGESNRGKESYFIRKNKPVFNTHNKVLIDKKAVDFWQKHGIKEMVDYWNILELIEKKNDGRSKCWAIDKLSILGIEISSTGYTRKMKGESFFKQKELDALHSILEIGLPKE